MDRLLCDYFRIGLRDSDNFKMETSGDINHSVSTRGQSFTQCGVEDGASRQVFTALWSCQPPLLWLFAGAETALSCALCQFAPGGPAKSFPKLYQRTVHELFWPWTGIPGHSPAQKASSSINRSSLFSWVSVLV